MRVETVKRGRRFGLGNASTAKSKKLVPTPASKTVVKLDELEFTRQDVSDILLAIERQFNSLVQTHSASSKTGALYSAEEERLARLRVLIKKVRLV